MRPGMIAHVAMAQMAAAAALLDAPRDPMTIATMDRYGWPIPLRQHDEHVRAYRIEQKRIGWRRQWKAQMVEREARLASAKAAEQSQIEAAAAKRARRNAKRVKGRNDATH